MTHGSGEETIFIFFTLIIKITVPIIIFKDMTLNLDVKKNIKK